MCPGRLPAVLALSIAWLQAPECGAAFVSNAASTVALSQLNASRESESHHHHHHRHHVLADVHHQAGPNLTQAQEFLKADLEAGDDFVRRCQVVVTVSDHKFLPIQPLERFCGTTDAVVECRLAVGQRLKATHARDGDMGEFCSAAYDWFQVKYGMKCPSQCRKLQCKSTCMWLEAKKKLNKDDFQIKDDMSAAEDSLKRVKGMGQAIHEKLTIEKKMNFSIKMLNVKLERAKTTLAGNTKDQAAHKNKTAKVIDAYKKLENAIDLTKQSLIKQADIIMKQKFAIDKAKLKHEGMTRSFQRDTDRAKEDREEQKSLQAESDKLNASITELNTQKASLTKSVAADTKAANAQAEAYKKKVDAMMKAAKELDAFKVGSDSPTLCGEKEGSTCKCNGRVYYGKKHVSGKPGKGPLTTFEKMKKTNFKTKEVNGQIKCSNGEFGDPTPGFFKHCWCEEDTGFLQEDAEPHHDAVHGSEYEKAYGLYMNGNYKNDPSVPIIKELVENQRTRVRAAEKLLYALQKKIRESEDEIKEVDADIKRLESQKKEAQDAANGAKLSANGLEKRATDGKATMTTFQANNITGPETKMQQAQDKEKKTHASKAKAERTLKHMGELLKEQQAKLDSATASVSAANLALKTVEDQITLLMILRSCRRRCL